jgi:hypothetical protein
MMYHAIVPWSEPRSFDALLDVPPSVRSAVEPYLVRFTYVLHDLSEISDDELCEGAMRTALAKLAAMCLGRWMNVAREVARAPNGLEALVQVMRYILEVNEHVAPGALQALLDREIGPETKDTVVTAGQQLLKQGIEQGIEQGIARSLINVYEARFGAMLEEIRTVIEATHDEPTLLAWLKLAGTRGADEVIAAIRAFHPS